MSRGIEAICSQVRGRGWGVYGGECAAVLFISRGGAGSCVRSNVLGKERNLQFTTPFLLRCKTFFHREKMDFKRSAGWYYVCVRNLYCSIPIYRPRKNSSEGYVICIVFRWLVIECFDMLYDTYLFSFFCNCNFRMSNKADVNSLFYFKKAVVPLVKQRSLFVIRSLTSEFLENLVRYLIWYLPWVFRWMKARTFTILRKHVKSPTHIN